MGSASCALLAMGVLRVLTMCARTFPLRLHRRAAEYKEFLVMKKSDLHKKLGFVAAGRNSATWTKEERDTRQHEAHGSEAKYNQALSHHNHSTNTHDLQAILHKVRSFHLRGRAC